MGLFIHENNLSGRRESGENFQCKLDNVQRDIMDPLLSILYNYIIIYVYKLFVYAPSIYLYSPLPTYFSTPVV